MDQLFETEKITFHNSNPVSKARKLYAEGNADFSDCYLSIINQNAGCDTTYTFEKKAAKLSSFSLLN